MRHYRIKVSDYDIPDQFISDYPEVVSFNVVISILAEDLEDANRKARRLLYDKNFRSFLSLSICHYTPELV